MADTEKQAAAAYGVLLPGIGIANRVTFIIGADGKVAYIDKDVNGHLTTCGADWAEWVKAHPESGTLPKSAEKSAEGLKFTASSTLRFAGFATVGQAAPTFTLPDTATGKPVSLTTLTGNKKSRCGDVRLYPLPGVQCLQ